MDSWSKRWQAAMAPLMVAMVVVTAVFFAVITVWKVGTLEAAINRPISATAPVAWTASSLAPSNFAEQIELATIQAQYGLEREVIARRYAQGNLAFQNRVWTRFMGFVTGMILALVGAAFVLGKLSTDPNELAAQSHGASLTLRSASPGVVLAVLGTLLMSIAISVPVTVNTNDAAVYFRSTSLLTAPIPPATSADPANEEEPQPTAQRKGTAP